jgi:uncharacterized protein YjbI with pentapeptide repeats
MWTVSFMDGRIKELANLRGADLSEADLSGANLRGADLRGANLRGADLHEADLSEADLRGANLRGTDLSGADLSGANLAGTIPVIPDIDKAILTAIQAAAPRPGSPPDWRALKMEAWHTCQTSHCRAGWAIVLAGEAGARLEQSLGPAAAGALIYAASRPDKPVPNFYSTDEAALADIIACASEMEK